MTNETVSIRIAGNTHLPALLALEAKGFKISLSYDKIDDPSNPYHPYMADWQAEKDGSHFSAVTPVELLGLAAMWEVRGYNWRCQEGERDVMDELIEQAKVYDAEGNIVDEDDV